MKKNLRFRSWINLPHWRDSRGNPDHSHGNWGGCHLYIAGSQRTRMNCHENPPISFISRVISQAHMLHGTGIFTKPFPLCSCSHFPPTWCRYQYTKYKFQGAFMGDLHPRRLTWNLKITHLKRKNIWTKPSFFGFQNVEIFGGAYIYIYIKGAIKKKPSILFPNVFFWGSPEKGDSRCLQQQRAAPLTLFMRQVTAQSARARPWEFQAPTTGDDWMRGMNGDGFCSNKFLTF